MSVYLIIKYTQTHPKTTCIHFPLPFIKNYDAPKNTEQFTQRQFTLICLQCCEYELNIVPDRLIMNNGI